MYYFVLFRLICEATGSPRPNYIWFKDKQRLDRQRGSCLRVSFHHFRLPSLNFRYADESVDCLQIEQCRIADSGVYRCLVTNGVHRQLQSNPVELIVDGKTQPCSKFK